MTVIYVRPQDVDLIKRVFEEAADDYRFARTSGAKAIATILDEYVDVILDQTEES